MPSGECPSTVRLRDYVLGCLDPIELENVAAHVRECESCLTSIDRLHSECDTFVAALRSPKPTEPDSCGPAYEKAIADLLAETPIPKAASSRLGPGSLLREYRILEALGEGGMGTVYRAFHLRLEREVALKVVRGNWANDPLMVARFQREMRAAGRFKHPHIVQATDAGEVDGIHFLVMEFVPGIDLAALVRREGPLPIADACELVRQAAIGLQHAHQQGLVHRDIKPSNLRLTPEGEVKILDFGLALLQEDPLSRLSTPVDAGAARSNLTGASRVLGTNDYMAPEQWINSHTVDARADVYSLGCTLWFLLVGRPPASSGVVSASALPKHRADAPEPLSAIVSRMLAPRAADRFPSALEVARTLESFSQGHRLGAHGPAENQAVGNAKSTLTHEPGKKSKKKLLAAGVVAAIVIGSVAAYVSIPKPRHTEDPRKQEIPVEIDPAAGAAFPLVAEVGPELLPPPREWLPPEPVKAPVAAAIAQESQRLWAIHLKRPIEQTNSIGMKFALIPPGEVALPGDYTLVISKPFEIATHETTIEQFRQFVEATSYRTDVEKSGTGGYRTIYPFDKGGKPFERSPVWNWRSPGWTISSDDQPVVHVTHRDALAFCTWLSQKEKRLYRLPTWGEWQWANNAGAINQQQHAKLPTIAVTLRLKDGKYCLEPERVGQKKPNAWGLYDMLGNVEEWTLDFPLATQKKPGRNVDPRYNLGRSQGTMGGSFFSFSINEPAAQGYTDDHASDRVGFRVLREP